MKKILRKIFKTIAWCLFSIILLLILLVILIRIPAVQDFIKTKVVAYLENTIHTKVEISKLVINLPNSIELHKIYFEDQHKDTLLACDSIRIDIAMLKLLGKNIAVSHIGINGLVGNIKRISPDTTYNFDYIVQAFASTDTTVKAPEKSALKFTTGDVMLENIRLNYVDDVAGYNIGFTLNRLYTNVKTFDPFESVYAVPQLQLEGIRADIKQYAPKIFLHTTAITDTATSSPVSLALKNIGLKNIQLSYKADTSKMDASLRLDTLGIMVDKIDLAKMQMQIQKIALRNSNTSLTFGKAGTKAATAKPVVNKATDTLTISTPWKVQVASMELNNNRFAYNNNNLPKAKSGLDYAHMVVDSFNLSTSSLLLSDTLYQGKLNRLALKEQSGLRITRLQTDFRYSATDAFLKGFLLTTEKSKLKVDLSARYTSLADLVKRPGNIFTELSIDTCQLGVKEVLVVAPLLDKYLKPYEKNTISFSGRAKGLLGNLNIEKASLSGIGNSSVAMNGNIKGLPDVGSAYYNINLSKLSTTHKDILGLIPASSIPSNINIPEKVAATGYYKGTTKSFTSKINLKTSNGDAEISPAINTVTEEFEVNAILSNIDAGYILSQDSLLGNISLNAHAKGKGFNYKTMTAALNAEVIHAEIKQHVYSGLSLNATTDKGNAAFYSSMNDSDIQYSLSAAADIAKTYPSVQFNLQLDTLNLHKLNLYDDTLGVSANIIADFPLTNPDSISGVLQINQLLLYTNGRHLDSDSISLAAANENNTQSFMLRSDFANADWSGSFKLTDVPTSLEHTINKFYKADGLKDSLVAQQQWRITLAVNPASKTIAGFMPELKGSDTLNASVDYNSSADKIKLNLTAPSIHYGGQQIDMLKIEAATVDSALRYSLTADKAGIGYLKLYQPSLSGIIKGNTITSMLSLKDEQGREQYHLSGTLNKIPAGMHFSLDNDSLLLNRNKWDITDDNYAEYDTAGLLVHDFFISKGEESLLVNSRAPEKNAPLETTFKNFHLKTLSEFTGNDSLGIEGIVNGFVTISNLKQNPLFTSDVKIENIQYLNDTIGNIVAQISSPDEKNLVNNITLTAEDKNVILTGKYFINEQKFEQHLNIEKLGLHSLVSFSKGQLKTAGGDLNGKLDINGKSDELHYNGEFHFDSAYIVPSFLGEKFTLVHENVNLDNKGIHFNKFTMTDSAGNKAVLDGSVLSSEGRNLQFQLDLNADDFRVVNSKKADNPDLYGKLNIDAAIKVRGDIQTPDINANLRVNKQTDLTMVLPDLNPEVQDREGVVNFIDPQHQTDSSLIVLADTIPKFQMLAGLKLATNIQSDTSAAFTVVIDERNGDALKVKGSADLAASIDESGKVALTGSYEVQQGSYQLTLSVLKRKFDIQKGSTITWTGDPTQANINITATYFLKAPTIELMESELTGKTDEEKNKYKERLPITVLLKMNGELLKPDITFDIKIPEDLQTKWDDVETKLKQLRTIETEMSKQVFALLLLSRFVEEDPMASSAGGTTEGLVRESVSRILTDQINNLAGSLVKGVDLNVELTSTEDYSTGAKKNQTDLSVGVSKTMLNDRLRVNVGSNFMLEGANANQSTSTIAGDIAVDYALSADGRYKIRAYRKDEYEGTVEGQVVESGLTFIITMNYDKFKELFQKHKKDDKKDKK